MQSTEFLYHALMIKYASKKMDMMYKLLVIRVNYKKTVTLITV